MKIKLIIFLCFASVIFSQSSYAFSDKDHIKSDSLKSLDSELGNLVVQTFLDLKVPGAIVGVFMGGYAPFTEAIGVQDLETKQPMILNDKMRIGSITKTFTGTVLLQLVDEGKISLNDKLSKYFPDYPNGQNITIEELGNMTSGIFNYSEDDIFVKDFLSNISKPFTPEELIDISKKHEPYFAPGTDFHYSNTNTILLGLIIEKITGSLLQTEIQNRILNPLGMKETTFATDTTFPDPHPQGYYYMDSTSSEPTDVTYLNPSWGWSAGAIISTLGDLQLYVKPLATGQLISKKSQEERLKWIKAFTPSTGEWADKPLNYGFAIGDFDGAYGHNGGIPGFNSFVGYLPEKDAVIIVLANMQDNKAGMGPADFIARKIIEKLNEM
jgi:D-alanyl-D-alanine carboxypeptidase